MTNRHASKQHGLVGNNRPKSKLRKRKNKAKARERRVEKAVEKALGAVTQIVTKSEAPKIPKTKKAPAKKEPVAA